MSRKKNKRQDEDNPIFEVQPSAPSNDDSSGQELVSEGVKTDGIDTVGNTGRTGIVKLPLIQRIAMTLIAGYDPKPMAEPEIDPDFEELTVFARAAEVIRYQTSALLYVVSPRGGVQALWKFLLAVLAIILPIGIVFYIILEVVGCLLGSLEVATLTLQSIAINIGWITLFALGISIAASFLIIIIKGFGSLSNNRLFCTVVTLIVLAVAIALMIGGVYTMFDEKISEIPLIGRFWKWGWSFLK